ncbi:MAG TPA: aminotransferase class I/II-fold pyridoxal phosphate-dependent enzyme [Candidatus Saccharimonadales bacterium]|nr:aminotransferase class I/II-fold pyridoxal phosphate-dependent enzyme [Candidatus Saccharimonadales bacterium]
MKKPIAIGLSPNIQKEDVTAAFKLLCMPWKYIHGSAIKELERWFRSYGKVSHAISFINARSALYATLHCLGIGKGDEVLLQAFTCVMVPNAIIATGAKPVYVDIGNDLTIDSAQLEKKITRKTKAIIVQHTFAVAADLDKIKTIAKKHNIFIIEDCAHTIGGEYKGEKLGTFGIAACYSFGRTKAFSSVFGGVIITNDKLLGQKIRSYQKQRGFPLYPWVMKQLVYRVLSAFILKFYYALFLGKITHFLFKRSRLFSETIGAKEKKGEFNPRSVKRLPNALAALALVQLKKQKEYNQTRCEIVAFYKKNFTQKELIVTSKNPLLRFPFIVDNKKKTLTYFAKRGIYIGDWYSQTIDPLGVDLEKVYYKKGSCPKAERIADKLINLPTYPTMTIKDAEKVVSLLSTL